MDIKGVFVGDCGFIETCLISRSLRLDKKISFLVDTGASKTTILDRDAIRLGINYDELTPSKLPLTGIGGAVSSFLIQDANLIFSSTQGEINIALPIYVLKHPLLAMDEIERRQILRLPSLLGRDIIARFSLTFDVQKGILLLSS